MYDDAQAGGFPQDTTGYLAGLHAAFVERSLATWEFFPSTSGKQLV
jgi:hypothetical protein